MELSDDFRKKARAISIEQAKELRKKYGISYLDETSPESVEAVQTDTDSSVLSALPNAVCGVVKL